MRHKLTTALGLTAALTLGACGPADEEPELEGDTTPTPSLIEVLPTQQSSCKHGDKNDTRAPTMAVGGTVEVVVTGSALEITHRDAYYNCAAKVDMKVKVNGTQIEVHEVILNPNEKVRCMCHYDLYTRIKGLAAGSYTISVFDADGKLVAAVTAVVGGSPPPDPCKPMDAQATGLCKMLITSYTWDGQKCVMLGGGCKCTGADCGKLFKTQEDCEKAYAACLPSCRDLEEKACSERATCGWHPCKAGCLPGGPCPPCCFPL
jgi:hypothetical protein